MSDFNNTIFLSIFNLLRSKFHCCRHPPSPSHHQGHQNNRQNAHVEAKWKTTKDSSVSYYKYSQLSQPHTSSHHERRSTDNHGVVRSLLDHSTKISTSLGNRPKSCSLTITNISILLYCPIFFQAKPSARYKHVYLETKSSQ